jgi:hypothetical protein
LDRFFPFDAGFFLFKSTDFLGIHFSEVNVPDSHVHSTLCTKIKPEKIARFSPGEFVQLFWHDCRIDFPSGGGGQRWTKKRAGFSNVGAKKNL